MAKIHGKQLRDGTLNPELLRLSGSSPTVGQILTYAGPNEFYWDSLSASLTGGIATDINGTSIDVRTDGLSIFVDGNNDLTLGDPTTGQIGGDYEFLGSIIIDGDLTVNGTATTINTTELRIEDNLITLNSNLTGSTSATTPFAGIEVLRSALPSVELRWNEASKWWEISNPEGENDPLTYAPILTTESIISQDGSVSITPLAGLSADTLDLSVTSLNNALSFGTGINVTSGTGPFDGSGNITIEVDSSYANDTFVTGGTYNNSTEDITFENNDGGSFTVDLSALDLNDTFTTASTLNGNIIEFDTNDQLNAYSVDLTPALSGLSTGYTFENGLTETTGTVRLGGVLTQATTISGNQDFNINLSGGSTSVLGGIFTVETNSRSFIMNDSSGTTTMTNGSYQTIFSGTKVDFRGPIQVGDSSTFGTTLVDGLIEFDGTNFRGYKAGNWVNLDNFTTGVTLSGNTLVFDTNDQLNAYNVDLSGLGLGDTFVTGGSISNGTVNIELNDGNDFDLLGNVVQSISEGVGITASTISNGDIEVGLDYASMQQSIPSADDKNQTADVTSGNSQNSGVFISNNPIGGYVGVSVNGVWYNVGNGVTTSDCYFSETGVIAKEFGDIVANDILYWNGVIAGFDLDGDDRISIYYNVLA